MDEAILVKRLCLIGKSGRLSAVTLHLLRVILLGSRQPDFSLFCPVGSGENDIQRHVKGHTFAHCGGVSLVGIESALAYRLGGGARVEPEGKDS